MKEACRIHLPGGGSTHTNSAGSGLQLSKTVQTDIICCDGTSPGLQWKVTTVPSCELVRSPRDPRGGGVGGPQPTIHIEILHVQEYSNFLGNNPFLGLYMHTASNGRLQIEKAVYKFAKLHI